MYNVKLISDTHLEHYDTYPGLSHFMSTTTEPVDIICLCGDIGDPSSENYRQFLSDCSYFCRIKTFVIYGNHEMYGKTQENTVETIMHVCSTIGDKVEFLNNTTFDIGEYRFIGSILWTQLDVSKAWQISTGISEFHKIKGWSISKWQRAFEENVAWLERQMKQAECDNKQVIVLTHHVPLLTLGHPQYAGSDLQSAFASDLSSLIASYSHIIRYWFYGHDHYSTHTTITSTIVTSNQFGYPDSSETKYDPSLVIEIK